MQIDSYSYTNCGGREYNEDAMGELFGKGCALWLLADGLGGHQGGRQASGCVAQTFMEAWERTGAGEGTDWEGWLREQTCRANNALMELQKERQGRMKSTVAALCVEHRRAAWVHVGDSRIYRLSDRGIVCLTEDHSVTYKKYKAGEIGREDINFDEDRSVLLRALGDRERSVPDSGSTGEGDRLYAGDGFLLCSDGFWEYLYEEEILADFLKTDNARAWGELMLLRIMQRIRPDSDNLSLITVRIQGEAE